LNRAIEQLETPVEIERIWYPFELNPNMPEAGIDRKTYRTNKFGSWEYSQMLDAKTVQAGKEDGIEFRYDLMKVTPNTLKVHRLTWLAGKESKATEMVERILRAYFTEGQDISDIETLANLAAEVGIDAQKAKVYILSDEGIEEVKELEQYARTQNIHSVPTIRIGKEILVGAQRVDVLLAALRNALNESELVRK
jgi:predicted DsbA family dithiol-disulfide isomerase